MSEMAGFLGALPYSISNNGVYKGFYREFPFADYDNVRWHVNRGLAEPKSGEVYLRDFDMTDTEDC